MSWHTTVRIESEGKTTGQCHHRVEKAKTEHPLCRVCFFGITNLGQWGRAEDLADEQKIGPVEGNGGRHAVEKLIAQLDVFDHVVAAPIAEPHAFQGCIHEGSSESAESSPPWSHRMVVIAGRCGSLESNPKA